MADPITLDITGFYYETQITDYDPSTATVRSITESARGRLGGRGGLLSEVAFSAGGSLAKIAVEFQNPPISRQLKDGSPFPPMLPSGTYEYEDSILNGVGEGAIKFTLAWQYYVFAGNTLLSNRPKSGNTQRDVVFADQATIADFVEPPTKILWRLVSIGGLMQSYEDLREQVSEEKLVAFDERLNTERMTSREAIAALAAEL